MQQAKTITAYEVKHGDIIKARVGGHTFEGKVMRRVVCGTSIQLKLVCNETDGTLDLSLGASQYVTWMGNEPRVC